LCKKAKKSTWFLDNQLCKKAKKSTCFLDNQLCKGAKKPVFCTMNGGLVTKCIGN
jgi:hypothetical protein